MKIAVTGHTSGLGKAIFNTLENSNGFSRTNGYDINNIEKLIASVVDHNVFINNASDGFAQTNLLYELFEHWQNQDKLIINISSNTTDGIKSKIHPYSPYKHALDKASEQLSYLQKPCKVSCIKPGWIDTERVKQFDVKKINPHIIVQHIKNIISSWNNKECVISTITVLPFEGK